MCWIVQLDQIYHFLFSLGCICHFQKKEASFQVFCSVSLCFCCSFGESCHGMKLPWPSFNHNMVNLASKWLVVTLKITRRKGSKKLSHSDCNKLCWHASSFLSLYLFVCLFVFLVCYTIVNKLRVNSAAISIK